MFLLQGILVSLLGVCQLQLHLTHGYGYDALSIAVAMFPLGVLLSSPLGTFCSRRLMIHNELVFAVLHPSCVLLGVLVPFMPAAWLLGVVFGLQGFMHGVIYVCECTILLLDN
jgi:hypothetical protein